MNNFYVKFLFIKIMPWVFVAFFGWCSEIHYTLHQYPSFVADLLAGWVFSVFAVLAWAKRISS